ncbi:MAG: prepilin-type N-terminal cleavage/methylation domain-containing protein [Thermodesulfovibrionales bacterium]|nr:prepilin-type N-terminal cleavage/methylation domain-containing protein [Thermodesulfovibrionales bacterium]
MKTEILQAGSKGFTLIELLIASSLIVIFLSIVLINTANLYEKFLLKEDANRIVRLLNRAKLMAMSERKPVVLRIDANEGTCWIEGSKVKVVFEQFKIEGKDIVFSPLGDNTGGTIKITDKKGRSYRIAIDSITSKITVEKD